MDWSVLNQWQQDRNQIELEIKSWQQVPEAARGCLTFQETLETNCVLLFSPIRLMLLHDWGNGETG